MKIDGNKKKQIEIDRIRVKKMDMKGQVWKWMEKIDFERKIKKNNCNQMKIGRIKYK